MGKKRHANNDETDQAHDYICCDICIALECSFRLHCIQLFQARRGSLWFVKILSTENSWSATLAVSIFAPVIRMNTWLRQLLKQNSLLNLSLTHLLLLSERSLHCDGICWLSWLRQLVLLRERCSSKHAEGQNFCWRSPHSRCWRPEAYILEFENEEGKKSSKSQ